MHHHDPELIAALAEGELDADEALLAEEAIGGCEECRAELAAQRVTLAAIAAAPRPGLSMAESADLRRAVASAVGMSPATESPRSRRPWLGLATAAAVVVALIAVAPVVNLLSTGSDAGSAAETTSGDTARDLEITAAEEPQVTTAAAAAEAPVAAITEAGSDSMAAAEDGAGSLAGDGSLLPDSYIDFGSVDELERFLAEVPQGITDRTASRSLTDDEIGYYAERFSAQPEARTFAADCGAAEALAVVADAERVITIGTAHFGEIELIIALVTTADDREVAVAIDAATCEVLAQVEV